MTEFLLRTGDLSFAYPERAGLFRRPVLRDVVKRVDLAVPRGSVLGLVGEFGLRQDHARPAARAAAAADLRRHSVRRR